MVILEPMCLSGCSCHSTSPVSLELGKGKLPGLSILVQLQPNRVEVDDVDVQEVAEEVLVEGDVELSVVLLAEQPSLRPR